MKIEKVKDFTQTIKLSEQKICDILKIHIVEKFGLEWKDSSGSLYEYTLPCVMGQIDDRTAIEARFKLVKREIENG